MNAHSEFMMGVTRRERRMASIGRVTRSGVAAILGTSLVASLLCLSGCSPNAHLDVSNSQSQDPATVDFPIFYVKRTIPKKPDDLRVLNDAVPSADLYMRGSASPSANETNVTARVTANASYDVKDVDTSADGTKIIFAMRGPIAANMKVTAAPSWRVWEYVIKTDTLHLVINASTDPDPPTVQDESPHYLPDGRIVFSSTRQTESKGILLDEGKPQFEAQDEDQNESTFNLHVMNADGTNLHQITFNQSHDRDATVLSNGRVLWTRWDHAPGKDAMHLYTANPDGTDLELYYGANSHMTGTNNTVIEFVKPREMLDGRILTLIRQYTDASATQRLDFGGDLSIIDAKDYVENTQPTLANAGMKGPAQVRATPNNVVTIPGPSPGGRFNSAYALWDGTGRVLVSWTQCRLLDTTQTPPAIVPCTSTALANPNVQTAQPLYSVWMFDPNQNTLLPVMPPVENVMVTDVVATQPRKLPNIILDKIPGIDLNQDLVNAGVGVIDIRSVYDFDGVDTANPNIPTVADPAKTPATARPARFIRLEKAVSIPSRKLINLNGAAFGASNYMREVMGYAPVEPDGSVHIEVPANVAFLMSILDANGRRITPEQGVWLQLIPGEVVSCNGCHTPATQQSPISHGRSGLFAPAYAGAATTGVAFPHTVATSTAMLTAFLPNAGETMAEARMRTSCASDTPRCAQMVPSVNVLYTDVWTDPAQATPGANISYRYDDPTFMTAIPTLPGCVGTWASNCRIVINYPEHIQPVWDLKRQTIVAGVVTADHTCSQVGCHNATPAGAAVVPAGQLDLRKIASNDEPLQPVSYRHLLFPHNIPGPLNAQGQPTTISVGPYMDAGSANGALSSASLNRFAPGSGSTHAGWMSPAELRLVSEWLDIGAQFFNNPFDPAVPVN